MKPEQGNCLLQIEGSKMNSRYFGGKLKRRGRKKEEAGNLLGFVPKAACLLVPFHQATGIGGDWSG